MTKQNITANKKNCCHKCGQYIDKSDTHKTWVTIHRKWYYLNDTLVKDRRILLCGQCGLDMLHSNLG